MAFTHFSLSTSMAPNDLLLTSGPKLMPALRGKVQMPESPPQVPPLSSSAPPRHTRTSMPTAAQLSAHSWCFRQLCHIPLSKPSPPAPLLPLQAKCSRRQLRVSQC